MYIPYIPLPLQLLGLIDMFLLTCKGCLEWGAWFILVSSEPKKTGEDSTPNSEKWSAFNQFLKYSAATSLDSWYAVLWPDGELISFFCWWIECSGYGILGTTSSILSQYLVGHNSYVICSLGKYVTVLGEKKAWNIQE